MKKSALLQTGTTDRMHEICIPGIALSNFELGRQLALSNRMNFFQCLVGMYSEIEHEYEGDFQRKRMRLAEMLLWASRYMNSLIASFAKMIREIPCQDDGLELRFYPGTMISFSDLGISLVRLRYDATTEAVSGMREVFREKMLEKNSDAFQHRNNIFLYLDLLRNRFQKMFDLCRRYMDTEFG